MDFSLIEKMENDGACYKLLKANFYRDHYVIIVQTKNDFCCGSIRCPRSEILGLFQEIAQSNTDPNTLCDILSDCQK